MSTVASEKTYSYEHDGQLKGLFQTVFDFTEHITRLQASLIESGYTIHDYDRKLAKFLFRLLNTNFNLVINCEDISTEKKATVIAEVRDILLPYLAMTETANRFYVKPRGYAGDYLTIAKIYDAVGNGADEVGALLDDCFLAEPAAVAVRNRRYLLSKFIRIEMERQKDAQTRVMSIACGPAQELFDMYSSLHMPNKLHATLVDIDGEALEYVTRKSVANGLQNIMKIYLGNVLHFASGRRVLAIEKQHLIYSVGLIDYFDDNVVLDLINYCFDNLVNGGTLILGNFHPRNSNKALMDHILEWKLQHRSEADMHRLCARSKFGRVADAIHFEEEGINLFAECRRNDQA